MITRYYYSKVESLASVLLCRERQLLDALTQLSYAKGEVEGLAQALWIINDGTSGRIRPRTQWTEIPMDVLGIFNSLNSQLSALRESSEELATCGERLGWMHVSINRVRRALESLPPQPASAGKDK